MMPEPDLAETQQSDNPLPVFVYGTLKPGESNYAPYCEEYVIRQTRAIAQGQLFDLPFGYPAMILGHGIVHGFLLWFDDPSVLANLDELEAYAPARSPEENEYERYEIEVFDLEQASLVHAWTYLMTMERVQEFKGIWLPDGHWTQVETPQPTVQILSNSSVPDWIQQNQGQRLKPLRFIS